jgi:hypothetical protein
MARQRSIGTKKAAVLMPLAVGVAQSNSLFLFLIGVNMKIIPIVPMTKTQAAIACGSLTSTSKMPCKSYSLPTEACKTGFKMAQIDGSICHSCYADKGFYKMYENNIKPAQFSRLDSITGEFWVSGMVSHIGKDAFFRWHDSGDLQNLEHLEKIAAVCQATPNTMHWLPTREYRTIKEFIEKHGKNSIPKNLIIRLSAMYPDKPVQIPASLQNVPGITASNVHTKTPMGTPCKAPQQNGACLDCRECWTSKVISYELH